MSEYDWKNVLKKLLKTELLKREMTYQDLIFCLQEIGVQETEANLKNKISRGTFSAIFFIQCLKAIEVKHLSLDSDFFETSKKTKSFRISMSGSKKQ